VASGHDKLAETLTAWSYSTGNTTGTGTGKGGAPEMMARPKSAYERKQAKAQADAKHKAVGKDLLAAPAMMPARHNPDQLIPSSRVAPGRSEGGGGKQQQHDYNNIGGGGGAGGGAGDSSNNNNTTTTTNHTHSHYNLAKLMTQSAGRPKTSHRPSTSRPSTSRPSTSRPSTSSRRSSRASSGSIGGGQEDDVGMRRPQTAPSGFGRPARSSSSASSTSKGSPRTTVCVSKLSNPHTGNQHLPCHCDPRQIPTLSDGGLDTFIKRVSKVSKAALVAVLVTERGTATAATEEVLLKVFTDTAGRNIFPCTTFPDADVIVVKAFGKIKVKGKAGSATPGLLATRHNAETGMVLFYGGGALVHAKRDTRPLRGVQDFQTLLKQARSKLVSGRTMPADFQFT